MVEACGMSVCTCGYERRCEFGYMAALDKL